MWDVVWYKRDLRLRDHVPLQRALACGRHVVLVHLFEPEDLAHPTTSNRHLRFRWESWKALEGEVAAMGWPVQVVAAASGALEWFEELHRREGVRAIWSHEETGLRHTFDRDRAVGRWCRERGVEWVEVEQQAVVRGLKHREDWADRWHRVMGEAVALPKMGGQLEERAWEREVLEEPPSVTHGGDPGGEGPFQPGGEAEAHRYLKTFLEGRVKGYRRRIGEPAASRRTCSRLSPYLAWGCISMRQVYHAFRQAPKQGVDRKSVV